MVLRRRKALLYCSFCRKDENRVEKLIGGPGVYICDACVGVCNQILGGRPAPPFPGWQALGEEDLLRSLRPAASAVGAVEAVLREQVRLLRERGVAWERIGDALGTSRQAAWERFSGDA